MKHLQIYFLKIDNVSEKELNWLQIKYKHTLQVENAQCINNCCMEEVPVGPGWFTVVAVFHFARSHITLKKKTSGILFSCNRVDWIHRKIYGLGNGAIKVYASIPNHQLLRACNHQDS